MPPGDDSPYADTSQSGTDPHTQPQTQTTGQHRLGPHVVGKRVVVRRLIPGKTGPSGGPAMTDVLGVCEIWGDGQCSVRTASGEIVTIPTSLIVSGKPVPPRTSVRHRLSAADAERHSLVLWPQIERVELGAWTLRSDPAPAGRLIKRANSCLAIGDPGIPLSEAVEAIRGFYATRERPAIVQVEQGSEPDAYFAQSGWSVLPGGSSLFQVAASGRALRTASARSADLSGLPLLEFDDDGPRVVARIGDPREPVAIGRGALDGDWFGIHGFEVAEPLRHRGVATHVLAGLLDWAASQGANTAWLHVQVDNEPARRLYEGLGFVTHHALSYRSPTTQPNPLPNPTSGA